MQVEQGVHPAGSVGSPLTVDAARILRVGRVRATGQDRVEPQRLGHGQEPGKVGRDAVVAGLDAHEPGFLPRGLGAAGVPGREAVQLAGEASGELGAAEAAHPVQAGLLQLRPRQAQGVTGVEGVAFVAVGGHDGSGEQGGSVLHRGHVAVVEVPGGVGVQGGRQVLGQGLGLGDAVVGGAVPDAQRRAQFRGEDLLSRELNRLRGTPVGGGQAGVFGDPPPAQLLHGVQTEGVHPGAFAVEGDQEVDQRGVPSTREGVRGGQCGCFEHVWLFESFRGVVRCIVLGRSRLKDCDA